MNQVDYDVAIVGYGPVGQTLAALLGQSGYRVGIFERWPDLYPLPRACVVDHEVMRTLQKLGVAQEFSELAVATAGEYVWLNAEGQTLYHFKYAREGVSGWPARNLMYQPDLERVLDDRVRRLPAVEINQGWEAVECRDGRESVELVVMRMRPDGKGSLERTGETRRVVARYVVGADGANSFVRQSIGIPWTDLGFRADWLVVDYRPDDPKRELDMPEAGQICDPARPTTLMRRMGRRHVRWEFMLQSGETAAEITRNEVVWSLISRWVKPEDGTIDRAAVYTFRSGVAESWQRGHVILAGDAAHLMPPFLGQGLCSGLRDALSLGWRLDLVLKGIAAEKSLSSYEEERKAHVRSVIDRAVALGKVVCITDPHVARLRDEAILSGTAPAVPPFPWLTTGVLQRDAGGEVVAPAGQLGLQAIVSDGRLRGRFDDVFGAGWHLITLDSMAELPPSLEAIGLRAVSIGDESRDPDGAYRTWLQQLGVRSVIVRPDFYIFGAAKTAKELPEMLDDLQHQLRLQPVSAPTH